MGILLATFKAKSAANSINLVVGIGYGGILALKLAKVFTVNGLGGILLVSCPVAPVGTAAIDRSARAISWSADFALGSPVEPVNLVVDFFVSDLLNSCLKFVVWPWMLRRAVDSRYGSSLAGSGRFGKATVQAAVRRAEDMGGQRHLKRVS